MSASLLWNFISRTENCLGCWIFFPIPLGLPHLIPQTGENNMRWNDYNKNWWDEHMKIFFSPYPGDKWVRSKGCWFEIPLTENFKSVCCGMKSILNNKNNMTKIIRTRPGAAWKLWKQIIHWQTLIRKKNSFAFWRNFELNQIIFNN